ncbi:MAG: hypothetical protein HXK03_00215 [Schaalia georgiae]|uniref:Uncharacterized protein n=1 Tax=Schaalia georgiae TaxID=52768 RepID=A0A929QWX2_9ACTO|nr:hypothetical protein [Schaalia georgiae]
MGEPAARSVHRRAIIRRRRLPAATSMQEAIARSAYLVGASQTHERADMASGQRGDPGQRLRSD